MSEPGEISESQHEEAIAAALAAYFHPDEIEWKPKAVKNGRALALAFVSARAIMDRLDRVVGPFGWKDDYTILPNGNVICHLSIKFNGEWVTKVDVGGESAQTDKGDKQKAAFSSAIKRAAVKWGIGRYLYKFPAAWFDYDEQKKRFTSKPTPPTWAIPRPAGNGKPPAAPQQAAKSQAANPTAASKEAQSLPANGAELLSRLKTYEKKLVAELGIKNGELIAYVQRAGKAAGFPERLETWEPEHMAHANALVKAFPAEARQLRELQQDVNLAGKDIAWAAKYLGMSRVPADWWGFTTNERQLVHNQIANILEANAVGA